VTVMQSDARKAYKAKWYVENKNRIAVNARQRYLAEREVILAKRKAEYAANREFIAAMERARYRSLSAEEKQGRIRAAARRDKANPEQAKARVSLRRKRHQLATPTWLNKQQKRDIKAIYMLASLTTKVTGVIHHVDHIVPLASKLVCGLHVAWNLQILKAEHNVRKANTYWPDMP